MGNSASEENFDNRDTLDMVGMKRLLVDSVDQDEDISDSEEKTAWKPTVPLMFAQEGPEVKDAEFWSPSKQEETPTDNSFYRQPL